MSATATETFALSPAGAAVVETVRAGGRAYRVETRDNGAFYVGVRSDGDRLRFKLFSQAHAWAKTKGGDMIGGKASNEILAAVAKSAAEIAAKTAYRDRLQAEGKRVGAVDDLAGRSAKLHCPDGATREFGGLDSMSA